MSSDTTFDYPILRIIGGPATGRDIPITGDKVTLGRSAAASISIADTVISRVHVEIRRKAREWLVRDMCSTNGTWVQGKRIEEVVLPMKIPVRIGNTLFELALPETESDTESFLDEASISCRINPITAESLVFSSSPEDHQATIELQNEQKKLSAIYQVQSLLTSVSDEKELYERILEVIDDIIPSHNSYLLSASPEEGDILEPVAGQKNGQRVNLLAEKGSIISRGVIEYVRHSQQGILSLNVLGDDRFGGGDSIINLNILSVMCVPMMGKKGHLCGLIYLSITKKSDKEYKEGDLQLLTMIAYSAGMAIENSQLIEENIRSERLAAVGIAAASLSHYVKNILNGLGGSVDLLRMGIDSSDTELMKESWDILSKNHNRLSSLMLDLLNLAKKEDSIDVAKHNIVEIIMDIVLLVSEKVKEKKIDLEVAEALYGSEIIANVDGRGIHRVLLNLVTNAIDAVEEKHKTEKNGKVKIDCFLEDNGQIVAIKVKDNGSGIPESKTNKVFEMFYTGKGDQGNGLGLAVSKRIIERHYGNIIVESVHGSGTTFIVKVPVCYNGNMTNYLPTFNPTNN